MSSDSDNPYVARQIFRRPSWFIAIGLLGLATPTVITAYALFSGQNVETQTWILLIVLWVGMSLASGAIFLDYYKFRVILTENSVEILTVTSRQLHYFDNDFLVKIEPSKAIVSSGRKTSSSILSITKNYDELVKLLRARSQ